MKIGAIHNRLISVTYRRTSDAWRHGDPGGAISAPCKNVVQAKAYGVVPAGHGAICSILPYPPAPLILVAIVTDTRNDGSDADAAPALRSWTARYVRILLPCAPSIGRLGVDFTDEQFLKNEFRLFGAAVASSSARSSWMCCSMLIVVVIVASSS